MPWRHGVPWIGRYVQRTITQAVGDVSRCSWCGAEDRSHGRYCEQCGKQLGSAPIPGKCVVCGNINAIDARRCAVCGSDLDEGTRSHVRLTPIPVSCRFCGRPSVPGTEMCRECMGRYGFSATGVSVTKPSLSLIAAGILLIVAGLLAALQGVVIFGMEPYFEDAGISQSGAVVLCGTAELVLGLVALAGGFFALRATNYGLVLAACICAIISFGLFAATVLGAVALVLVWSHRSEFRH
jgi:hypothetical protein